MTESHRVSFVSSEIPYTKEIKPGLKGKFRTILLEFKEKKQRGGEQTAALSGIQKREVGVEQEQVILSRLEAKLSSRRNSESS